MKKFLLPVALVCASLSQQALAEDSNNSLIIKNRIGTYYVEANLGSNLFYAPGEYTLSSGLHGVGYAAAAGYYYGDTSSLEVGIMQSTTQYKDDDNDEEKRGTFTAPYATFRFNTPIGKQTTLITKLGAMYVHLNADKDDVHVSSVLPFTGIGLGYAVTDNFDINIQYQGAVYVVAGFGLLTGGASYHFG